MKTIIQKNTLMGLEETTQLIKDNHTLVLSADENILSKLPKGNWIGGTIPYFYLEGENGKMDKEQIFVTDFTSSIVDFKINTYQENSLENICVNGFDKGFNFLILPALRDIHLSFALNSPAYPDLFTNPLLGLIAGTDLDEFSQGKLSKTFNGKTLESFKDAGVALQAKLAPNQVARLEIINVFKPSEDDITIEVEETGFLFEKCLINGKEENLYDYIKNNNIDIAYPLVADYSGATINVSFQRLDEKNKQVVFYAPLFEGRKYKFSKHFESYTKVFKQHAESVLAKESKIIYNCNCILNYLHGELDKNSIGFSGATTFGEIAYNLINQTFTYLAIDEY